MVFIFACRTPRSVYMNVDECERIHTSEVLGMVLLAHVNLNKNTCLPAGRAETFQASEVYN